jgi:hypothetical protein
MAEFVCGIDKIERASQRISQGMENETIASLPSYRAS